MTSRYFQVWLGCAGLLLVACTAVGAWALWQEQHDVVVAVELLAAVPFCAASWLVWRHAWVLETRSASRILLAILATAAVMRLMLIPMPPVSTDVYRYVWDGRVQGAGINPYRFVPADQALAALHDRAIYPNINRAETATTIYPPFAQIVFAIVTRVSDRVTAMKIAMTAFEALTIWAILVLLKTRQLPLLRVLLYAWHPLSIFEIAGSGHMDVIAIAMTLCACVAADRRRLGLTGALIAIGVASKFFPLAVAPALYRRWDWRAPVVGLGVLAALYLPYLGVGWRVLGYLPGYAQEEGLTTGSGFFTIAALQRIITVPPWMTTLYFGVGLLCLAVLAFRNLPSTGTTNVRLSSALLLLTSSLLLLSPHLAWYFTWLVPFLAFVPSAAMLVLTCTAPVLYGAPGPSDEFARAALVFLPFLLVLAIETTVRLRGRPAESYAHAVAEL